MSSIDVLLQAEKEEEKLLAEYENLQMLKLALKVGSMIFERRESNEEKNQDPKETEGRAKEDGQECTQRDPVQ